LSGSSTKLTAIVSLFKRFRKYIPFFFKSGTFDVEVKRESVLIPLEASEVRMPWQDDSDVKPLCSIYRGLFFRDSGWPEKKPLQTFHLDPGLVWKKRIFYSLSFALF
jgi:hypothetical protein